jgi:4-amino-4-deoxy-L-arabinose transferase-like glycosyltransferase
MKLSPLLFTILCLGLLLRLAVALSSDPLAEYTQGGGDTGWYLANGEGLLSGNDKGISSFGVPYLISQIPTPPLYLMFVGVWQKLASPENAIAFIRVTQAFLSMGMVLAASRIAWLLTRNQWGMWLTLLALTFDPAHILEPRNITTETLYTTLILVGLWVYAEKIVGTPQGVSAPTTIVGKPLAVSLSSTKQDAASSVPTSALLVGLLLGLATLTRAVGILFPLALVVHFLWVHRQHRRQALKISALLLFTYTATIGIWTVYNLAAYNRFVIVSNQFMPAVWRGAVNNDGSPQENDTLLLPTPDPTNACTENCGVQVPTSTYVEQTANTITSNPLSYLTNRLRELANAILLPYATTYLGGESLRDLFVFWVQSGFSGEGLSRLVNGDDFWLKLLIYIWQFTGYGLAIVGAWRTRYNFRVMGAPLSFIVYTIAIHVILLALPRYIFPILPCCWILASGIFHKHSPSQQ